MNQQSFEQHIISAPNDRRRQQITAIIAWSAIGLCISSIVNLLAYHTGETSYQMIQAPVVQQIGSVSVAGILIAVISLLLLRARHILLPGALMTVSFFALIFGGDDFVEIAGGRSTIFLTLPVLIAAITIRPYATFVAAGISTVILAMHPAGVMEINVYAIGALWMLSFFIWLATTIMEKAITTAQLETQRVRAMLGIVSHELRTPLGSINGYVDLLLLGRNAGDLQFEMLTRMKDAARALIALVNRLLDSAHIQSGKLDLKPVAVPIDNIFKPVIQAAEKQAQEKGLKFEADLHNLPDAIVVDALRLQQVVMNLLDNAVKYTGQGKVSLEVAGLGNKMQIIVRDTGCGIAPEHIRMIFQEFSQVQHYATRDQGGVGLGLYIVHSLVQLMGGSIRVESKLGTGSAFTVTLPLLTSN